MAQIGWIDFSIADRKKMNQAMSLIRPEGQLDELGIGRIRDGLADKLFPGISTIQTIAKYFFIIPYILRDYLYLSSKQKNKTTATGYLLEQEHKIKNRLREKYAGQNNTGIIGITLTEKQYSVRQPSEVYWVGINTFGCMDSEGLALSGFLKNLNQQNQHFDSTQKESETDDDFDAGMDTQLQISVPTSANWQEDIDVRLSLEEANFLKANLQNTTNIKLQDSVLNYVFKYPELLTSITQSENFSQFANKAVQIDNLSPILKKNIVLAHDFAIVMDGAHMLYNHLLQEHFFKEDYDGRYFDEWKSWHQNLQSTMINYQNFHIADLNNWLSDARDFVSQWWGFVKQNEISDMQRLLNLLEVREHVVKGKKARLRNSKNNFNEMKPNKWIGLRLLQYRFFNAKRIIVDILNPI